MHGVRLCALILGGFLIVSPGTLAQTSRDSAGVRVVENAQPAMSGARAWRLSPTPILQIGSALDPGLVGDSLYELLRVNGVVRLTDGRLAVANDGSLTVRHYDEHGKYVGYAGRKGEPDNIKGRAFVVDVPQAHNGKGRVLLFANHPIYRWQNHGEFNMVFNAIINWDDVPPAPPLKP